MKKLLLVLPLFLMAENYQELSKLVDNSLQVKMQKQKIDIYKHTKINNYGSLDVTYGYIRLKDTPISKLSKMPVGDKDNYTFELKYSYPLFTGFNISSNIDKIKLETIKEKLNLDNLKRVLKLQIAELYSEIYSLNENIKALKSAKQAVFSGLEVARGLYKEGLLNESDLKESEAKFYQIDAEISEIKSQKNSLLNSLSYILNKNIKNIDGLENITIPTPNFENRADIKAIKTTLKISNKDIKIAKSKFYPQIGLVASYKREGENMMIDKNKYSNIDKSYVGIQVSYNLFNGNVDKENIQKAKLSKLMNATYYQDYLNKIKTDYQNDLLELKSLKAQLTSAKKETDAREVFYQYQKAKFKEGLINIVDLNDAISKLATAKANKESIKAKIFFLSEKLRLNGGNYEK